VIYLPTTSIQLDFFCSKSANRFRNCCTSRCSEVVTAATKKKHIGKKQRNTVPHPDELERNCIASAINEMKAQNAAGVQCAMFFMIFYCVKC